MPISLDELQTPLTEDEVRTVLTDLLTALNFPVTAWQEGGAARSFLEMQSSLGASLSERTAALSKQGYLSTATAEFLDALALSHYDETRTAAIASVFNVDFVNAGTTTHGPFTAGSILARSTSGQLFESTGSETITASTTTVVAMKAQLSGAAGNIPAGALQLVTPLAGVTPNFAGTLTTAGSDTEGDPVYRERARSKWTTLRVEKTSEGVEQIARSAAPNITGVSVDDANPRGAGTVDVYLAADNAVAGTSDVNVVQAALDIQFFGNGIVDQLVKAFPAVAATQDLTATVYVRGVTEADITALLTSAWQAFLITIPLGGFDLSPGPEHTVQRGQIIEALSAVPGVVSVDLVTPAVDLTSLVTENKVLEGTTSFTIVVLPSA